MASTEERLSAIEAKLDRVVQLVERLEPFVDAYRAGGSKKLIAALMTGGRR